MQLVKDDNRTDLTRLPTMVGLERLAFDTVTSRLIIEFMQGGNTAIRKDALLQRPLPTISRYLRLRINYLPAQIQDHPRLRCRTSQHKRLRLAPRYALLPKQRIALQHILQSHTHGHVGFPTPLARVNERRTIPPLARSPMPPAVNVGQQKLLPRQRFKRLPAKLPSRMNAYLAKEAKDNLGDVRPPFPSIIRT